jgi:hypothetical protein
MTALAAFSGAPLATLVGLVDRAAVSLSSARTAAEVLDARDHASFAYDAAKKTARLMKAKQAHDELIAAAYRAQADALEIEAQAKRRLADEYDAAQERGEARSQGGDRVSKLPDGKFGPSDIGLDDKQLHEARIIRDAETAEPGVVRRTLDHAVSAGQEPTRASLKRAVAEVVHLPRAPKTTSGRSKEMVCARVADAVRVLSGLPPAEEVASYFQNSDEAVVISERIGAAVGWLRELLDIWEKKDA